ncbi:hypothetical protein B0H13DRAFT_2232338 [Mycena leptocephala]|nr:hypothetical protein B0H13DRAFT_2232338 [Mycena leptocephala]
MDPTAFNHPCVVCGRPTTQWCSRCRSVFYCSPEHLQGDWPHHRERCRPSAQMFEHDRDAAPSRARVHFDLCILFLANEVPPPTPPSDGLCPIPLLQPYFDAPPDSIVLLRFPLHVFYSPTALTQGTPMSRSIHHITSGAAAKPWCGNVVAFKFSGSRRQGYTEAGSNDLPALSAYFLSYR